MSAQSLAGVRVLVTRPEGDGADAWARALAERGALPILFPTVAVVPPESWQWVDDAVAHLDRYDWLLLTSKNAVLYFTSRLPGARFPVELRARIAAVGSATAKAISERGGRVTVVPADERQEGLVNAMTASAAGTRVLFPVAADGRMLVVEALRKASATVDVVVAYRTQAISNLTPPAPFDAAVFASPSALRAFVQAFGAGALDAKVVAVIGPTTAREARNRALSPVVAVAPTIDAVVDAIVRSYSVQGGSHVVP